MSSSNNDIIVQAIKDLIENGNAVSLSDVYQKLQSTIFDDVQGQNLNDNWKKWRSRIINVARNHNLTFSPADDREKQAFYNIFFPHPLQSPTAPSTGKTGRTLSVVQKNAIQAMFSNLDTSKMWRLSTGTLVEQQMDKLALECKYEHSCHSLILDIYDTQYNKYFTAEERDETRTHNASPFPTLPDEIEELLTALEYAPSIDACLSTIQQQLFSSHNQPALAWIQQNFINTARMFSAPASAVNFRELASSSSRAAMNMDRMDEGIDKRKRSRYGHKVDMLFRSGEVELGCLEAGKEQGNIEISTKEWKNGYLKQPKVLKDMLYVLSRNKSQQANVFRTVGLTLMGHKLTMMVMDSPNGYVGRLQRTDAWYFPNNVFEFVTSIPQLLRLTWTANLIMEATLASRSTANPSSRAITPISGLSVYPSLLQPSFYATSYPSSTHESSTASSSSQTPSTSSSQSSSQTPL
ncbi:unnamed protein product [Absidia cylindrospora]